MRLLPRILLAVIASSAPLACAKSSIRGAGQEHRQLSEDPNDVGEYCRVHIDENDTSRGIEPYICREGLVCASNNHGSYDPNNPELGSGRCVFRLNERCNKHLIGQTQGVYVPDDGMTYRLPVAQCAAEPCQMCVEAADGFAYCRWQHTQCAGP